MRGNGNEPGSSTNIKIVTLLATVIPLENFGNRVRTMRNAMHRKASPLVRVMVLLTAFASAPQAMELHYLTIYAGKAPQAAILRDNYLQMVRARIEKNRQYPLVARKQGQEGQVLVRFVIADDGGLEEVKLKKSCGDRALDEAALAAVRSAAPFPAPPDEVFPGSATMRITIVFSLR